MSRDTRDWSRKWLLFPINNPWAPFLVPQVCLEWIAPQVGSGAHVTPWSTWCVLRLFRGMGLIEACACKSSELRISDGLKLHAADLPFILYFCACFSITRNIILIPSKNHPFKSRTVVIKCKLCQEFQYDISMHRAILKISNGHFGYWFISEETWWL